MALEPALVFAFLSAPIDTPCYLDRLAKNQLCGLEKHGCGIYTAEGITKLCEGLKGSAVTSLKCAAALWRGGRSSRYIVLIDEAKWAVKDAGVGEDGVGGERVGGGGCGGDDDGGSGCGGGGKADGGEGGGGGGALGPGVAVRIGRFNSMAGREGVVVRRRHDRWAVQMLGEDVPVSELMSFRPDQLEVEDGRGGWRPLEASEIDSFDHANWLAFLSMSF